MKNQNAVPKGEIPKKSFLTTYKYTMLSIIGLLSFLLIWQYSIVLGWVEETHLAKPTTVLLTMIDKFTNVNPDGNTLQMNILTSLKVALSGFGLAVVIGTSLGWLMGWYKTIDRFVRPIFEIIRPIPPISWIPLTILWLGVGLKAKAFIIFFSAFVPCVINSYTGIKQANRVYINVAKTFGAKNGFVFLKVGIPSSLPMVFAGIRIALGNSWSTLVAAELLAANSGLGYMISMGRQFARVDLVVLGMLIIGAIGAIMTGLLEKVESKMLRWRNLG